MRAAAFSIVVWVHPVASHRLLPELSLLLRFLLNEETPEASEDAAGAIMKNLSIRENAEK